MLPSNWNTNSSAAARQPAQGSKSQAAPTALPSWKKQIPLYPSGLWDWSDLGMFQWGTGQV